MVLGIIAVLIIYMGLNYYVASCLAKILNSSLITVGIVISIFALITLGNFVLKNMKMLGKIGNFYFGFVLVASMVFGVGHLFLDYSYFHLVMILLIYSYGYLHQSKIYVKNYDVVITKPINSLKIALISDLHLGYMNTEKHLNKIVNKINQLDVDVVCIAGDIFDGNYYAVQRPDKIIEAFNQLKSNYGTYACLGNHDAGKTYSLMKEMLKKTKICLLEEESINVEDQFIIVGRSDMTPIGEQGIKRHKMNIESKLPVIVLDHQPSAILEYLNWADLVLCGHTHKGQIFPFNLVTKKYFLCHYGYFIKDKLNVIVTSGISAWGFLMRICSDNEIVCINVKDH